MVCKNEVCRRSGQFDQWNFAIRHFSCARGAGDLLVTSMPRTGRAHRLMSERSARHFSSSNAAAGGDKMGEGKMNFEVVIVGSGLAGLSVALNLAETRRVAVIAKVS